MNDVIVSVRMTSSMAEQLRLLAKTRHFLDISEEIRTIVREKAPSYLSPYNAQVKRIVDDLRKEIRLDRETEKRQALISNLKNLLEELQDE